MQQSIAPQRLKGFYCQGQIAGIGLEERLEAEASHKENLSGSRVQLWEAKGRGNRGSHVCLHFSSGPRRDTTGRTPAMRHIGSNFRAGTGKISDWPRSLRHGAVAAAAPFPLFERSAVVPLLEAARGLLLLSESFEAPVHRPESFHVVLFPPPQQLSSEGFQAPLRGESAQSACHSPAGFGVPTLRGRKRRGRSSTVAAPVP